METLNVQFETSDADAAISIFFGCPQDPDKWANLGTVTTNDPRWRTFYEAAGEFGQIGLPMPTTE